MVREVECAIKSPSVWWPLWKLRWVIVRIGQERETRHILEHASAAPRKPRVDNSRGNFHFIIPRPSLCPFSPPIPTTLPIASLSPYCAPLRKQRARILNRSFMHAGRKIAPSLSLRTYPPIDIIPIMSPAISSFFFPLFSPRATKRRARVRTSLRSLNVEWTLINLEPGCCDWQLYVRTRQSE